jgi:hypothetical protein
MKEKCKIINVKSYKKIKIKQVIDKLSTILEIIKKL